MIIGARVQMFYGMPGTSPGTILSFNVVHMDSVVIIVLVNKQVEGMLSWIRDQRAKKQGNKGTVKSCETSEIAYTFRYTSGHAIPNSVMVID